MLKWQKRLGYVFVGPADPFSTHCPFLIWNIDHRFGLDKFFALKEKNEVGLRIFSGAFGSRLLTSIHVL